MQVKISEASKMIVELIKARLVPMVEGSPGMGKSAIVHQIAEMFGLAIIDMRLSQCDPTDLNGFPNFSEGRARYVPMDTFPLEGDSLPEGKNGWLLFLDEFSSAPPAVQSGSYKLVLDRMVGSRKLHKNVAIVCAGNKDTDGAIVHEMSTALQSRLVHMELVVDVEEWVNWASDNHFDHRIISYMGYRPDALYTFSPEHNDKTYACPRTWEFANRILKNVDVSSPIATPLLSGALSEGIAREFLGFCRIQDELPSLQEILAAPDHCKIPHGMSAAWAISGALSAKADKNNIASLMKYIKRLPIEIQVFSLRSTLRRDTSLRSNPAIVSWITTNGAELFSS